MQHTPSHTPARCPQEPGLGVGCPPAAGTRGPEAADPSLLTANIVIKESPAILRMWENFCYFFYKDSRLQSFCVREGYVPCQKGTLPDFIHQVMDIIIIGSGICHCRDLHSSSQEFHRNVEVSKHLFFKEIPT